MKEFSERLLKVTQGCRSDMHEPDEQFVYALVKGTHLDNAMGDDPDSNWGELTVGITRDGEQPKWFNLATLIALARIGAKAVTVLGMDVK